jgi:hypothetical protein
MNDTFYKNLSSLILNSKSPILISLSDQIQKNVDGINIIDKICSSKFNGTGSDLDYSCIEVNLQYYLRN